MFNPNYMRRQFYSESDRLLCGFCKDATPSRGERPFDSSALGTMNSS